MGQAGVKESHQSLPKKIDQETVLDTGLNRPGHVSARGKLFCFEAQIFYSKEGAHRARTSRFA